MNVPIQAAPVLRASARMRPSAVFQDGVNPQWDPAAAILLAKCSADCSTKAGFGACVVRCVATGGSQVCDGGIC